MPKLNFKEYMPAAEIDSFVGALWSSEIDQNGFLRLLPTASSVLMTCHTPNGEGLMFVGPMASAQMTEVKKGEIRVGAWLKPGVKIVLPNSTFSQHEGTKSYATELSHATIDQFEKGLVQLADVNAKLQHLTKLVVQLIHDGTLARDSVIDAFIAKADAPQATTVHALTKDLPIGERQFRRRFKEYVGLSPKEYLRISRQRRAIQELDDRAGNLTTVAAEQGYADQAHFSNEFRSYVGITPIQFEKELTIKSS